MMVLRNLRKMHGQNDGTRTLFESIMSVQAIEALKAWRKARIDAVLIGALALDLYVRPGFEDEVVFLVPHVPLGPIAGFQEAGAQTYRHESTGIMVRLETVISLSLPHLLAGHIFQTSSTVDGIQVASPSALVAILLFDAGLQASADIINLLTISPIDVSGFGLPDQQMRRLAELLAAAENEKLKELPFERTWRVGDLVTAPRMRHYEGHLLLCRVVAIFGTKAVLAPMLKEDLPRSVPLDQLALVEAWTGIEMLSCKEDGSPEHLPGDVPC